MGGKVPGVLVLLLCLSMSVSEVGARPARPSAREVHYWVERLDSEGLVRRWQWQGATLRLVVDGARWQEAFSSNRDFLLRALGQNLAVGVVVVDGEGNLLSER